MSAHQVVESPPSASAASSSSSGSVQPEITLPDGSAYRSNGDLFANTASMLFPYTDVLNTANRRDEQGSLFSASGVEDRLHQIGVRVWTKDRLYRGHLLDDVPDGLGQLRYPNGDVFEGEFVNGKKIGFGVHWNARGDIVECGVYSAGFLGRQKLKTGPVPRSKLLYGGRLSELARSASLLFPDGGCFVGPLNAQHQSHGVGKRYDALGVLTEAGLWRDGIIKQSAMVAPRKGGRRMALIIANTNYFSDGRDDADWLESMLPTTKPALGGTENSGRRMLDCLLELGFDSVESCFDGTLDQMKFKIRKLIDSLRSEDLVFLYFIGHGALVNGTTYLAPVDLCGAPMTDFAISIKHIRDQISASPNCKQLTVVMALDCCRVELDESRSCSEDEEEGLPRGLQLQHEVSQSAVLSRTASSAGHSRESRRQKSVRLARASVRAGNEYFIMHANEATLPAWAADGLGAFTRELLEWLPKRLEIAEMFREISASLKAKTINSDYPQLVTVEGCLSRKLYLACCAPSLDCNSGMVNPVPLEEVGPSANRADLQSAMLLFPPLASSIAAPVFPRRRALALWNSQHLPSTLGAAKPPPMPAVELSGWRMFDCLRELKFTVALCRNGTLKAMKSAIRDFVRDLCSGDLVFIYFVGHGAMVGKETYLLPTDIGDRSVTKHGISVQYIQNKISLCYEHRDCEKLTVVMALDCCQTERVEVLLSEDSAADSEDEARELPSVTRLPEQGQREESKSESEPSTMAEYRSSLSCSLHASRQSRSVKIADLAESNQLAKNEWFTMFATEAFLPTWTDGELAHFTRALLQYLPVPGLEICAMFRRANALLVKEAGQQASYKCTMYNDLFLAGQPPPASPVSVTPRQRHRSPVASVGPLS